MNDWQKYLDHVYMEENINNTADLMLTRLVEDLGKTSRSLRKHEDKAEVANQLAGILAWTFGVSNKLKLSLKDITWKKYPNVCIKCRDQKCSCSNFASVFLSYCGDTKESKDKVKSLITNEHRDIEILDFDEAGQEFGRMRMVEMTDAINRSDAGIVILDRKFSPRQYVEFIEIQRVINEKNKFVYVRKRGEEERDKELAKVVADAKSFQKLTPYESDGELIGLVRKNIDDRLREIKYHQKS